VKQGPDFIGIKKEATRKKQAKPDKYLKYCFDIFDIMV